MQARLNPEIRDWVCSKTGDSQQLGVPTAAVGLCSCCPAPGFPILVKYAPNRELSTDGRRGLGRFESRLPVQGLSPRYADDVGDTAVLEDERLSAESGARVFLKGEGQNPSGSFKDRGLAVGVALAHVLGATRVALPTQGNAGIAAALYSARLGMQGALLYMPEGYQENYYHRAARHFGAEVRFFGPNIAAAGKQMRQDLVEDLAQKSVVNLSTFFEPGRLEGKKTLGLEIAQSFAPDLPDAIIYPTGGGTGLVGIWKALQELQQDGLVSADLPKMFAVQSDNCCPLVRSWEAGLDAVKPLESRGTVADGLDVPAAIMGHRMIQLLRGSGGGAVAVSDREIIEVHDRLGRLGVCASYEAAATAAALRVLRATDAIPAGARVLLLATASQHVSLGGAASSSASSSSN